MRHNRPFQEVSRPHSLSASYTNWCPSMSVNLGPMINIVPNIPPNPLASGLGYNPRCLRRDLNPYAAAVTADNYTYSLITKPQNKDLYWFQTDMQGKFELGEWGVHTGGHYTVGADPGGVSLLSSMPVTLNSSLKTLFVSSATCDESLANICVGFLHLSGRPSGKYRISDLKQRI
jgi:hypothetical protein